MVVPTFASLPVEVCLGLRVDGRGSTIYYCGMVGFDAEVQSAFECDYGCSDVRFAV